MINAVGSGPKLAFHKTKDPVTLSLLPVGGGGACVCEGKPAPFGSKKGKLHYTPTNQTGEKGPEGDIAWGNSCAAAPRTVLLEQQNPTCDIRTYVGGQTACHHMWSLLDADQDIPWPDQVRQRLSFAMPFCIYYLKNAIIYQDRLGTTIGKEHSNKEIYALSLQPLEYHLKVRFWVQPYVPEYHTPVSHHATWVCETRLLRCHLYANAIFLPRQARDKHREKSTQKKTTVFSAGHRFARRVRRPQVQRYSPWLFARARLVQSERR
jgi:hypothetical protein